MAGAIELTSNWARWRIGGFCQFGCPLAEQSCSGYRDDNNTRDRMLLSIWHYLPADQQARIVAAITEVG